MFNKNILLLSLLVGVLTFIFSTTYLGKLNQEQRSKNELLPVVVVKTVIPARTQISKDQVELKQIPRQYVVSDACSKIEEVVGKISVGALAQGEQINPVKFSSRGSSLGLSVIIPKNKRAVSVEVDASASIAGLIKPGDMVDIVCTLDEPNRTVTILQNIQVLAIDQQMEGGQQTKKGIDRSVIATVALEINDAERLIMGSNRGRLKLLLRPVDDKTTIYSEGATIYNLLPYTPRKAGTAAPAARQQIRVIKGTTVENKSL